MACLLMIPLVSPAAEDVEHRHHTAARTGIDPTPHLPAIAEHPLLVVGIGTRADSTASRTTVDTIVDTIGAMIDRTVAMTEGTAAEDMIVATIAAMTEIMIGVTEPGEVMIVAMAMAIVPGLPQDVLELSIGNNGSGVVVFGFEN
jgi:hypothetical protein